MEIEFSDKRWAFIETDDFSKAGLPVGVLHSCRKKLLFLRSTPDERSLRNWKSLRYEKLKGDKRGQHSIRLNDQWRIRFKLNTDSNPHKIIVLAIEDYH